MVAALGLYADQAYLFVSQRCVCCFLVSHTTRYIPGLLLAAILNVTNSDEPPEGLDTLFNNTEAVYTTGFKPAEIPTEATSVTYQGVPIITIPFGSFQHLAACLHLAFPFCQISNISQNAWIGLDRLQTLNLSDNNLERLTSGLFGGLPSLRTLLLTRNRIGLIETGTPSTVESGAFHHLKNLQFLDLGQNRLTTLSGDMFLGLRSLEKIVLENNQIYIIEPGAFQDMFSLNNLNLKGNKLQTLEWSAFENPDNPGLPVWILWLILWLF